MSVVFQCPACTSSFRVAREHAGRLVECPNCKQKVLVPKDVGKLDSPTPHPKKATVKRCPSCDGEFRVADKHKHQPVACPHCGDTVSPGGKGRSSTDADMFAPGHQSNPKSDKPTIQVRTGKKKPGKKKAATKISLPQPPSVKPPAPEEPTPQPTLPKPVSLPKPDLSQKRQPDPAAEQATPKPNQSKTPPKITEPAAPTNKKKTATTPPKASETTQKHPSAEKDSTAEKPGTSETPDRSAASSVAHRLPPKFTAVDPGDMYAEARGEDHKVILPDGDGGFQRIDSRVVHVHRDGKKVQLYSAPKEKKERRRFLQNILAILIGILVLAVAFYLLLKW